MTLGHDDFSRLYGKYARSLLLFFQQRLFDPELSTDLMADTFTIALERREQFRGTTDEELSGWLWSIARSQLRDHERREQTRRRGTRRLGRARRTLTDAEIERIEELAGFDQLREAVARGLDALPPDQAVAVRMRIIEELPYDTIARRLDVTTSGARTRVTRALRQLSIRVAPEREDWREQERDG